MSQFSLNINPALIDIDHADDGMIMGSDSQSALHGVGVPDFPKELRIPRSDWDDWIREAEKWKSAPEHFSGRSTHQGESHECVHHARVQLFECAYNRQVGLANAVYFTPLAGYFEATGGRQWGGSNVEHALQIGMTTGLLPEHDGPDWLGGKGGQATRFKHTLHQTSGRSEAHWPTKGWPRSLPAGMKETSKHFRIKEAYYISDAIDHFSAVIRWGVGNGRQGHAIPHLNIVKDDRGRYLSKYRDSYHVWRYDTEALWGGGYCIRSVTTPDDPTRPAGADMKS